ncbi:MAG: polysaccharide pyruvyl transferase family protein [Candidatus Moranbacteria bacterium]|nr:polysaccharide pyruvyl transferase family protein [Candidatus Moranbacteria bacterium]
MQIVPKNKCSGCSACYSVCPSGAISMQKDIEGFLYPIIDEVKCTSCNLCRKTCPVLNKYIKKNQSADPACYAGWSKDEFIRKNSSSGGLFSIIAKYIFSKNGFVCGAGFDADNKLRHVIIADENDLPKLRGSKYLQSEIGDIFLDIKKLLQEDNWVLFVGTPCQVAGLCAFLQEDYEKLVTVDVMCHGTPSPLVFDKYMKDVEKLTGERVRKIEFRDKSTGWKTYSFSMNDENNNTIHKEIMNNGDVFGRGFLGNLYLKPLCTNCPFATLPRQSDITLGDFWAIGSYKNELDDDKGTSLILVNSAKGESVFNEIKTKIIAEKVPLAIAHQGNLALSLPCDKHPKREEFFEELLMHDGNIGDLISKHLNNEGDKVKNCVGIFNMRLPSRNFGATLQAFALWKSIENLGYTAKIINYISEIPESKEDKLCAIGFYKFRENFIKTTHVCKTDNDLVKLNEQFDTFVVGSDQVWNYNYLSNVFKNDIGKYFLNFVFPSKNIFSYAPSFAETHWKGTIDEIKKVKDALTNFSAISVREKEGVDICKNIFGFDAQCVLDPTFLIDESGYQEIINDDIIEEHTEKYIAYFSLDEKLEEAIKINPFVTNVIEKMNGNLLNIRGIEKEIFGKKRFVYHSVSHWLNYIKNSEFVITDSYHCVIFAIIFKKQFIVIARDYAGNNRLESLLTTLNIKNRFLKSIDDITNLDIYKELIDYNMVHKILDIEKEKSLKFLINSLKITKPDCNKVELLERELILSKLHSPDNIVLQSEKAQLQKENNNLQDEKKQLQLQYQHVQMTYDRLASCRAVRYGNKIKKYLKKIGMK